MKKLPVIQPGMVSFDDLLSGKFDTNPSSDLIITVQDKKTHTKESISYSEIATWLECRFRHKLKYIDKIDLDGPSEHTEFGQVIHDTLEEYLKTRKMPSFDSVRQQLTELFTKLKTTKELKESEWQNTIEPILTSVPLFLEKEFPGWEYVGSESELYEQIIGEEVKKFKGYIDAIIRVPNKKGGYTYYILDWKTTSWGWALEKKIDPKKTMQLVLYKYFWSKKTGIPLKDIRCGFVLLKRITKKERCELVTVSVGDKTLEKALDIVQQFLGSIKKGLAPKNRDSCTYCVYYKTSHCK